MYVQGSELIHFFPIVYVIKRKNYNNLLIGQLFLRVFIQQNQKYYFQNLNFEQVRIDSR